MFLQRGVFSPLSSLTHERPPKASEKRPENQHVNLQLPCLRLAGPRQFYLLQGGKNWKTRNSHKSMSKYTYQCGWLKKGGGIELELQYQKKTTDNIIMCYHEKISPYWSRLWEKAAVLTGRQNMLEGQCFIHLTCSLHHCERVLFWAVYNNTCALYFPQINGNAREATQDGCHRQVNLSTAEQRHTDQDRGTIPFTEMDLS